MSPDMALVIGLVLATFAIPAIISAYSDQRTPRAPALIVLIAGGMIVYAVQSKPGGYGLAEIPEVFIRVLAQVLN